MGAQDDLDGLRQNIRGEPGKDYPIFSTNILCKINPTNPGCGGGAGGANGAGAVDADAREARKNRQNRQNETEEKVEEGAIEMEEPILNKVETTLIFKTK